VHKVAVDPTNPDHLLLQNHGGVYRSRDGGDQWEPVEAGLPATFGFGVARSALPSGSYFLSPLSADMRRFPVDGRAAIYRSDDEGALWHDSSNGLPESGFHTVVLRDALTTDDLDPTGVYFGTRSGEVWASPANGQQWTQVAAHLPDVLCVRAADLGSA